MNRFFAKSTLLVLLLASLTGTAFLSPKQGISYEPGAISGAMSPGPEALSFGQGLRQYTAGGHVLGFREDGVVIASGNHVLKVEFMNARPVSPVEEGASSGPAEGQSRAPELGKVTYRDLWDGVTVVYEKTESVVVKSTYYIEPGETDAPDPVNEIRLRYNVPVTLDKRGNLVLSVANGEIRETRPVAWQEVLGKRVAVQSEYRLLGERQVGFEVGAYDPRYLLVIDPEMIWNTFLGGLDSDRGYGIAVDTNGNAYVTGYSYTTWGSPIRPHSGGIHDAFVAKLDIYGVLQWNTFLGGTGTEGRGIAVDTSGNVYVTGFSAQTWGSPIDPHPGVGDAPFIAKLDTNGALQWNTFLGGGTYQGHGIAVDMSGNAYATGIAYVTGSGLGADAFVAKLSAGGALLWNTFLGGTGMDEGHGIAMDTNGNSYLTGGSDATWGSPISPFTDGFSGWEGDAFVAKLDGAGALQWNTFLGGWYEDIGQSIAVDTSGNSYVGAKAPLGVSVTKLGTNGVLQWETDLHGSQYDGCHGIAVSTSGKVYLTGASGATWGSPINPYAGWTDAFVAELGANGVLQWNTFLGTDGEDIGRGIAVDTNGYVVVTGTSDSSWGSPIRPQAGYTDAFVVRHSAGSVTSPNGGEIWESGSTHDITWTGCAGPVKIEYSWNNGSAWTTIVDSTDNDGSYTWALPNTGSSQCRVRISNASDGVLEDTSDGAFTITGFQVTSPTGGEQWATGSQQTITWNTEGSYPTVRIELSIDGGGTWTTVESDAENSGSHLWTVPDTVSSQCLIRVGDAVDGVPSDIGEDVFSIIFVETISITSPDGGESWAAGSLQSITWTANTGPVQIAYSKNVGADWEIIVGSTENDGIYEWTVPDTVCSAARVLISDAADGDPIDISGLFSIYTPEGIVVIGPNGGESWEAGSLHDITWAASTGPVKIEYSLDNGAIWTTVVESTDNDGLYSWTVPQTPSCQYLVRISDAADGDPADTSDAPFSIGVVPMITVTSPNGGEKLLTGSQQTITWTMVGCYPTVNIELTTEGGDTWTMIASNTTNSGSYIWTVPVADSSICLIKVSIPADGIPFDASDGFFSIGSAFITLTSPNGGESWAVGSSHDITWTSAESMDNVGIGLSTDGGSTWTAIVGSTENDGTYAWLVPDTPSMTCLVGLSENDGSPRDLSDAVFSIIGSETPTITVTSPNGGESWALGSTQDITWTQTGLSGSVTVDLCRYGDFNKRLGTAEATAGIFSWTIASDVTPGTGYSIEVWQGDVVGESTGDFTIISTSPSKKTDFNGDGQEDLLWRYYGGGGYQGWNVVWLMNQTGGAAPLAIGLDGTSPASSRKGSRPALLREAPLEDTPASRQGNRRALSPMGIDTVYQKPKGVLRSPIEDGRRIGPPTMKDAEMAAAASGGEMKIASLGIDGYLYLDTISDLSWEIVGTGDFDGDTDTDILWRNYGAGPFSGWNVVWYMNSTGGVDGYGYLSGITDLSWRIVGTGDFDGDGDTDILWRNYGAGDFAGWNVVWYLNGETIDGYGYLPGISDLDWKIVGTGDFNRDGYLDILWRNCGTGAYSGWNVIWYMAGEGIASYGYLSGITDLSWEIAGTGDFNNDGHMDILWRNYGTGGLQGWNCIWYMQGEGIIGYDYPTAITDTNWRIVNR
jgi:hypothetical protein